jgi:starvation-inducible DNA-binding protein
METSNATEVEELEERLEKEALETQNDLNSFAVLEISNSLRQLLADVFGLYVKTKNFHWHMSGPHFRDYHLLLDEQAEQIFAMTDVIAERARKIGGTTIRSVREISRLQSVKDNDEEVVASRDMLVELYGDNQKLARNLRSAHVLCNYHGDVATASLIEVWIDETERRQWFLAATIREP